MKSSANPSAHWSRRSATMKSCGLSNGCAEASGSFVTTRLGAEKTEPCSTFPWQFHQSKTRAGRLLVRQELHATLPSVSETIADAPPSTWSPACWLAPGRLAEAGTQILEAVAASGDWAYAAIWVYDDVAGGLRCRNLWHEVSER